MSLKRPLEAISFPDNPDCSTQFDANLDNSIALSFAFAKYVAVTSFQKCLKEDCTSKIKNPLIIPKIENITFPATANAVVMAGAKPVLVDINLKNLLIDEKALTVLLRDKRIAGAGLDVFSRRKDGKSEL